MSSVFYLIKYSFGIRQTVNRKAVLHLLSLERNWSQDYLKKVMCIGIWRILKNKASITPVSFDSKPWFCSWALMEGLYELTVPGWWRWLWLHLSAGGSPWVLFLLLLWSSCAAVSPAHHCRLRSALWWTPNTAGMCQKITESIR